MSLILAPLRGVTIRSFRRTFTDALIEGGFDEALTPFVTANAGVDPLKDRELDNDGGTTEKLKVTPQFIGKDPAALRFCLRRIRQAGYDTADLNCGCPFPMVRGKGRGSGLMRTPETLRRMLEAGCEEMGEGRFSIKLRLGIERTDELAELMPIINAFPLRFITVHARTAKQMYEGKCDSAMFETIAAMSAVTTVRNGDVPFPPPAGETRPLMIGRGFIRSLASRDDIGELLTRYIESSRAELHGERPVLGRLKELIAYWKDFPAWHRRWAVVKISRSIEELMLGLGLTR